MKSIFVPIYFPSGNFFHAIVESYTKIGEVKAQVMKKVKFHKNKIPYYCLYEVCTKINQNKTGNYNKNLKQQIHKHNDITYNIIRRTIFR